MEYKLEDGQCSFCPDHSTTDHIFTLKQIFEKSSEYDKDLFARFVGLKKHMTEFEMKFRGFCSNITLMVNRCLPLSLSTANQKSLYAQSNQRVHNWKLQDQSFGIHR